jgi:hypothetical protein
MAMWAELARRQHEKLVAAQAPAGPAPAGSLRARLEQQHQPEGVSS